MEGVHLLLCIFFACTSFRSRIIAQYVSGASQWKLAGLTCFDVDDLVQRFSAVVIYGH